MVLPNDERYEKMKDEERRLIVPEDVKKERLWNEFRKESVSIICLAFMYAKNFEEMGHDITERWTTAEQQAEVLETVQKKAYLDGYEFGFTKGREYEREWIARKSKDNNSTNTNSNARKGAVQQPHRDLVQQTNGKSRKKGSKRRNKR